MSAQGTQIEHLRFAVSEDKATLYILIKISDIWPVDSTSYDYAYSIYLDFDKDGEKDLKLAPVLSNNNWTYECKDYRNDVDGGSCTSNIGTYGAYIETSVNIASAFIQNSFFIRGLIKRNLPGASEYTANFWSLNGIYQY